MTKKWMGVLFTLVVAWTCGAWAQVVADPAVVTFTAPEQRVTIRLTHDGAPLAAGAIQGHGLMVENSNYGHMVTVEKREGAVVVGPSAHAEVGSYDLVIRTAHGPATVKVFMPLSELEGIVEEQAKALGITATEVMERLGIAKRYGQETVTFPSPMVVYVGEPMIIETPCPPGRAYEWRVDGELVHSGGDVAPLRHTFAAPGLHAVSYRELVDGRPVASGAAAVTVVPRPTAGALE